MRVASGVGDEDEREGKSKRWFGWCAEVSGESSESVRYCCCPWRARRAKSKLVGECEPASPQVTGDDDDDTLTISVCNRLSRTAF